jgi:hypothetical protein
MPDVGRRIFKNTITDTGSGNKFTSKLLVPVLKDTGFGSNKL